MVSSELPGWGHPAVKREVRRRVRPFGERGLRQQAVLLAVFWPVEPPWVLGEARKLVETDLMRKTIHTSRVEHIL